MKYCPKKARSKQEIPPKYQSAIRECCGARHPWPLTLLGNTGNGKTCAALSLLDHLHRPVLGLFLTLADLCEELILADKGELREEQRMCAKDFIVTKRVWWERWEQNTLCVIDEIGGRERVSDFQRETLQRCLDKREGRATVLTANTNMDDLAEMYGDRIASRIEGGTYCWLDGEDRRLNDG